MRNDLALLLLVPTLLAPPAKQHTPEPNECYARQFQCEVRCDQRTQPGSMKQLECRDRCREKLLQCLGDE